LIKEGEKREEDESGNHSAKPVKPLAKVKRGIKTLQVFKRDGKKKNNFRKKKKPAKTKGQAKSTKEILKRRKQRKRTDFRIKL